jgi:hypothetical protein
MPIRKSQRGRYPKNWPAISWHIRFVRANSQCECEGECGLHHGRRCQERHGEKATWANGKIVLTVAHLNHVPEDVSKSNLKAMCQTCHNRYDREHRAATRRQGTVVAPEVM